MGTAPPISLAARWRLVRVYRRQSKVYPIGLLRPEWSLFGEAMAIKEQKTTPPAHHPRFRS